MVKIVNKKINIFNDNCYDNKSNKKFAKSTFMLCSLLCFMNIQSSIAQNSNKLVVPVKCAGNSNQKYEECAKSCENVGIDFITQKKCGEQCYSGGSNSTASCWQTCTGENKFRYISYNSIGGSFLSSMNCTDRCSNDTEARNSAINKCKASCEFFKNQCSSYEVEIDTIKFLESMPEIGVSRVDPNFIEYE